MSVKNENKLVRTQSLPDGKPKNNIFAFFSRKNNSTDQNPDDSDTSSRRRSLFTVPSFSPLRRRSSRSLKFTSAGNSPKAKNRKDSAKRLSCTIESDQESISSPMDIQYDSPKHPPYLNHKKFSSINNMSPKDDAELMVCADAFITKSGLSVQCTTPTPSRKNSDASPLTHGDLMEQVNKYFQFDQRTIDMTINASFDTPSPPRSPMHLGQSHHDSFSSFESFDASPQRSPNIIHGHTRHESISLSSFKGGKLSSGKSSVDSSPVGSPYNMLGFSNRGTRSHNNFFNSGFSVNSKNNNQSLLKSNLNSNSSIDNHPCDEVHFEFNLQPDGCNLNSKCTPLQINTDLKGCKSDSCLSSPEENREFNFRLKRNLTLPIKAVHHLNSLNSPLVQRSCVSLQNTPAKLLQRSLSEVYPKESLQKLKVLSLPSSTSCHSNINDKYGRAMSFDPNLRNGRPISGYVDELYGKIPETNEASLSSDVNNNNQDSSSVESTPLHSAYTSPSKSCGTTPLPSPYDSPRSASRRLKAFTFAKRSPLTSPKKSPKPNTRKNKYLYDPDKESLTGYLYVNVNQGKGFTKNSDTYVQLEIDSYGHFFRKAKTKPARGSDPTWDESFEFEIEACRWLRFSCYNKLRLMGYDISGKVSVDLTRENLNEGKNRAISVVLDRGQATLNISLCYSTSIDGIKKSASFTSSAVFGVPISVVAKREMCDIPVIVIACIKEIEKRGMDEIGIYRLSGVASEIQHLKKLFNEQTQSAVLILPESDIHAVAGLLKLYFRELPQCLFTGKLYHKFVEGLSITDAEEKELYMCDILQQLPRVNKMTALYLFEHLRRVVLQESDNKMGVNNLATVFGPTVLRPPSSNDKENERSLCNVGTFDIGALDVMSQVGIFRYILGLKNNERTKLPPDDLELWRKLDVEKASKLEEQLLETAEEHLI